jgi:hypothetical protein
MSPGRGHIHGWTEHHAAEAVKERDAAAAAIDAEVFAGVVPPPPRMRANPDPAHERHERMSSAVIGGFCEHSSVVHELVAKFAGMTAKETAKGHGWQLKEATDSIPEAPHTPAAGHRGMARLPRKQNRAPAPLRGPQHRVRTHAPPPAGAGRARWRTEKNRAQSHALGGTQGVGGSAADHRPFGGVPLPPRSLGCGAERRWERPDVSASLAERAAAMHR